MIARALIAACILVASSSPMVAAAAPKGAAPAPKVAPAAPRPAVPAPKATAPATKPPTKVIAPAPKPAPPLKPAPKSTAPGPTPATPEPSSSSPPAESSAAPAASNPAPAPAPKPPAHAEPPPTPLVIDFQSSDGASSWFVSGLEEVVRTEFLRFHTIELAKKIETARCPGRDPHCLVDEYRSAGVQVIVLGRLETQMLKVQVYETWTGTRAFDGALRVSGVTTSALQRQIGEIVRRIVQRGGVLDQRPAAPSENASPKLAARASLSSSPGPARAEARGMPLLIAAAIVFVAAPVLLALLIVGTRELGRRATPASWKWSALLVAVLSAIPIASSLLDVPVLFGKIAARAPPLVALLSPVAAGMLWGAFGLTIGVWVFAPIHGLERIRHDALWPLMRSWVGLTLRRVAALLVLYVPILELTLRACAQASVPSRTTLAFIVPAAGLLTYFWLLSLVDNLTVYLDARLSTGPATPRNPWHATIKRYFRGYVRRGVIELDDKLLERTVFLPSTRPDVISYGGGFARPRILVGEKPLEAALGELPDEEEFPDRTVNPEELPVGIVMPSTNPDDSARLARADQWRRALTLAPPRARAHMPRLLGENATLLGWVLPQPAPAATGIPLISDTEEDFGVVKRLLSEHYAAFEGILHGDEVDDTDPTQKDFLFGALLREMGIIARRDALFATLWWSLVVAASRKTWIASLLRLPIALYERLLATPGARVADAYAALNGGLHHLVQYLCFGQGIDEALLTARANAPRLADTSRQMLAQLDRKEPTAEERDPFRTTARDRAAWLTRIFHGSFAPARIRWVRVLGSVAFAAVLGVLLVRSASKAIAYHPTYVDRMKSQIAQSTEGENTR